MNNTFYTDKKANSNNIGNMSQQPVADWPKVEPAEIKLVQSGSLAFWVQCLTASETAILLSIDVDTVRDYIKSGKLRASKVGREWLIRVMDIDSFLTVRATVVSLNDMRFKTNRKRNSINS